MILCSIFYETDDDVVGMNNIKIISQVKTSYLSLDSITLMNLNGQKF